MISNNINCVFSHSLSSPESDIVILERVGEFFDVRDVGYCKRVCTLFSKVFGDQKNCFWAQISLNEGVPLVKGQDRNRKEDFQILRSITVSGARINQTIGRVVGEIPCISEGCFKILNCPDPFESEKSMKDNWVFVVLPACVSRIAGPQAPLDLDNKGDLIEPSEEQVQNGKELTVPLSLKNLQVLSSYPLKEGEENKVSYHDLPQSAQLVEKYGSGSGKTEVYLMRKSVVHTNTDLPWQEQYLAQASCTVTPIRLRVLFDCVTILETGLCPDNWMGKDKWSCVACSNHGVDNTYIIMSAQSKTLGVAGACLGYPAEEAVGVIPCVSTKKDFEIETCEIFGTVSWSVAK